MVLDATEESIYKTLMPRAVKIPLSFILHPFLPGHIYPRGQARWTRLPAIPL